MEYVCCYSNSYLFDYSLNLLIYKHLRMISIKKTLGLRMAVSGSCGDYVKHMLLIDRQVGMTTWFSVLYYIIDMLFHINVNII